MKTRKLITLAMLLAAPAASFVTIAMLLTSPAAQAEVPAAIAASGEQKIAYLHAEGAQVYECKAGANGTLAWAFREPVATLIENGKTVGRHYAGPAWEMADGSIVMAKVAGRAPAASTADIPLLKLEVTERKGNGAVAGTTTIQRINTKGGVAEGACPTAGALLAVPYSADYAFLKK